MSGLDALLAGHRPPGTYAWPAAPDTEDVRRTVERAGWRFAHLDSTGTSSKSALLEEIGLVLGFPDHYGRNLDALADLLAEVTGRPGDGVVLLWEGWETFARADPRAFAVTLTVLGTRVHAERGDPFVVLLRAEGEAPADLPRLD